jgi:hypothetical protein
MHKHRKPVTRRDFLAQGFLLYGGMISLPNVFGLGMRKALQECGGGQGPTMVPYMAFDMAGGAALPGNFLVGGKGGPKDFLGAYTQLGWNPLEQGALYEDFGLPMSLKYSKLLKGILDNTTAEARKNFRMGSICHFAQDDSSSNKLNSANLALAAGYRGTYVTNGFGINDSPSGGNSMPVISNIALKPTIVHNMNDVMGAVSFGGAGFQGMKVEQLKALAEGSIELSRIQKNDYMDLPDGNVLADLSKCAYEKSLDFLSGVEGLDPRRDTDAQQVYQIDQNTDGSTENVVAASLAMNTLKGYSGPSVWTLGDCDYHTGEQTKGDMQDEKMGIQIGKAIQLAYRLQKPLFFQLFTDGGCDSQPGTRNWAGDVGDKCMTVLGYYNPKQAPKFYKDRMQIGYYNAGQGAERSTIIGSEPALVGYAAFANYLNICGKIADFSTYAPGVFTGKGELDSILIFEGA